MTDYFFTGMMDRGNIRYREETLQSSLKEDDINQQNNISGDCRGFMNNYGDQ